MLHFETWIRSFICGMDSAMKNNNERTLEGEHNKTKIVISEYWDYGVRFSFSTLQYLQTQ